MRTDSAFGAIGAVKAGGLRSQFVAAFLLSAG
jgi:hypothetical protein